jgi:putative membrane protein
VMCNRYQIGATGTALLILSGAAWGQDESPAGTMPGWTWPSYIIIPLLITGLLYAVGVLRMRQRSKQKAMQGWPVLCFAAGWLSLLIALDSPIHELSEQLFSVHMAQHEILMIISAPLLVISRPLVPLLWALPESWRDRIAGITKSKVFKVTWSAVSAPFIAWLLHALALWIWHAPVLFDATLSNTFMHAAQHISFLGTALLFWWALFNGHGGRLSYGRAVVYVFTTAVHTSILGALLTFAPSVWYTPYVNTAPAWHLTPLDDQQLGGLIMWIPGGTVLVIAGLFLFVKWMQESDRRWQYTRTADLVRASAGAPHES